MLMTSHISNLESLVNGVLAGDARRIGQAITAVEQEGGSPSLLQALFPKTGRAQAVGVTGPPGAGKSTLVQRMAQAYRRRGQRVGIVAVDPSSPFTGGPLLGGRIPMAQIYTDPGAFHPSLSTPAA